MTKYYYCPKCKERSVIVVGAKPRTYDGLIKRKEICINKGCTYSLDLDPQVPTVKSLKAKALAKARVTQGQVEFNF